MKFHAAEPKPTVTPVRSTPFLEKVITWLEKELSTALLTRLICCHDLTVFRAKLRPCHEPNAFLISFRSSADIVTP